MAIAPPRRPPSQDELDALVREARAHQRRRRLLGVGLVAFAAGVALSVYAVVSGSGHGTRQGRSGTPVAVGALPRCRSDQLRLTGPRENGAYTGHSIEGFTFTNISSQGCVLRGWPAVAAVVRGKAVPETTKHSQIRNGAPRTNHLLPVSAIRLRPLASAAFDVVATDPFMLSHPPCVRSSGQLVTPPGGGEPLRAEPPVKNDYWPSKYCGLGLMVTPLVSGRIDRYQAG
jgi:Protein of unknown function (DUF4232)